MLSDSEMQRLAGMVNKLRPEWPAKSVLTLLREKHSDRAFADLAVALAHIAADSTSKTPARINEFGPWWLATKFNVGNSEVPVEGPGRGVPACSFAGHEHEPAHACRWCAADRLVGEHASLPARAVPRPAGLGVVGP